MEKKQSAENHTAVSPLQHFFWLPLSAITLFSIIAYIVVATAQENLTFVHIFLLSILLIAIISGMLARIYALKLQDRLIRTEETLRYYMLTQKKIDEKITVNQLIGLRFASDEEFVSLVEKTINEDLSKGEIKQIIKNWRADNHRI